MTPYRTTLGGIATLLALLLAGCGGSNSGLTTGSIPSLGQPNAEKPVSLTRPSAPGTSKLPPSLKPVNKTKVARSLQRYLVNNGGKPASHKIAGADLDGDGTAEALIYLEGESWCAVTGCTLLVMRDTPTNFEVVTQVKRVRLPVAIAPKASYGWRDLLVKTGLSGGTKLVTLAFNGSGYPGNANSQTATVPGLNALPEIAIRPVRTVRNTADSTKSDLIPGQN